MINIIPQTLQTQYLPNPFVLHLVWRSKQNIFVPFSWDQQAVHAFQHHQATSAPDSLWRFQDFSISVNQPMVKMHPLDFSLALGLPQLIYQLLWFTTAHISTKYKNMLAANLCRGSILAFAHWRWWIPSMQKDLNFPCTFNHFLGKSRTFSSIPAAAVICHVVGFSTK